MSGRLNISKSELEELYSNQKLNTYQISEKLNCCQATVWKRLIEFDINRRRSHDLNSNVPSENQLIEYYFNKKLSTWQIEKLYGFSRGTIHRKLKEFNIKIRDRADSHIINFRKNFSEDLIEKAYLIGFRLGDLGVRKIYPNSKTIYVASGSTINEQIELIKSLFAGYGQVRIKTTNNNNNKTNIWVALDESFDFLLSKKIPFWVDKNDKTFFSFVSGFIDAEGHIGIYNNMARFSLGNYNIQILNFIRKGFSNRGIGSVLITDKRKGKFNNQGYPYRDNYSSVRIHNKQELLKLFYRIKPYIRHKLKIEALKKAEENIIMRNNKHG